MSQSPKYNQCIIHLLIEDNGSLIIKQYRLLPNEKELYNSKLRSL